MTIVHVTMYTQQLEKRVLFLVVPHDSTWKHNTTFGKTHREV